MPYLAELSGLNERRAERIKFRDLNADFAGDSMRGGSAEPLVIISERTQMTTERTKQLQDRLEVSR
jgi:uncharacterized protein YecT (DUF1311 family)